MLPKLGYFDCVFKASATSWFELRQDQTIDAQVPEGCRLESESEAVSSQKARRPCYEARPNLEDKFVLRLKEAYRELCQIDQRFHIPATFYGSC